MASTPVTKGPQKRAAPIDFETLTAEDKLRIHESALKKAREIKKKEAEAAYEKIALEEALREEGLEEEQVTFRLDLAEFANKLVIDQRTFFCQTVFCRDCKKLYDAVTRLKEQGVV